MAYQPITSRWYQEFSLQAVWQVIVIVARTGYSMLSISRCSLSLQKA